MAYSEKVIDHYQNPRNVGSFGASSDVKERKDVGVGIVGAPECGDVMQLQIRVGDDGLIEDAKFKCFGCGSAIASSSLASERAAFWYGTSISPSRSMSVSSCSAPHALAERRSEDGCQAVRTMVTSGTSGRAICRRLFV